MSDTMANLRRQIGGARELQSVVRVMKALAAASIGQYEQSVRALGDYARTVELGLHGCGRGLRPGPPGVPRGGGPRLAAAPATGAVVFGSDQGLVGQFNEVIAEHALAALAGRPGRLLVWAVGERVHGRLADAGLVPAGLFAVPASAKTIVPLVGQILVASELRPGQDEVLELQLFYNRHTGGASYAPASQRLLPLDEAWYRRLAAAPWPSPNLPEVLGEPAAAWRALLREYLFVSLFRACAESLASENASRLAAMERADRNIDELLAGLQASFHQVRQSGIDEELFDLIAGFEALSPDAP